MTRFFPVVPAGAPAQPDQVPVMYLNLVATGTPAPAPPSVTLTMEASGDTPVPFQGGKVELDSPTVTGFLGVAVSYDRVGPAPAPDAGESRFQLAFFLVSGSLDALRSTLWSVRLDAGGGGAGQSFSWTVTDRADDTHPAILPVLAARRATVGTGANAAQIVRFTNEAIGGLTDAERQSTVPTGSAVKAYVDGVARFAGFSYHTNGVDKARGWSRAIVDVMDYNAFGPGSYDTRTSTFTAPLAGYYRFSTYGWSPTPSPSPDYRVAAGFALNQPVNGVLGQMEAVAGGQLSRVDSPMPFLSHVLRLNTNDMVSLWVYSDDAIRLGGATGTGAYYFQCQYLGQ